MKRLMLVALLVGLGMTSVRAQDWGSILGGVVKGVVGDKLTTGTSLKGTWRMTGPDCRFESDNLLAKAGGEAVAGKVEEKLTPVYERLGLDSCELTFQSDSAFTLVLKGRTTTGTYAFDEEGKTVTLRTRLGLGVTASVEVTGTTMRLLFKADRLLEALRVLTNLVAKVNESAGTVDDLAGNYDGLMLGLELTKASEQRPSSGLPWSW